MRNIDPDHPSIVPEKFPNRDGLNDTFFHPEKDGKKADQHAMHTKRIPAAPVVKPKFSVYKAFLISIGMAAVTGGYLLLLIVVLGLANDPFYAITALAFSFFALLITLFFSWALHVSFNTFCSVADVRPGLVALCSSPAVIVFSLVAYNSRSDPLSFALLLLVMAVVLCVVLYIVYIIVHAFRPHE